MPTLDELNALKAKVITEHLKMFPNDSASKKEAFAKLVNGAIGAKDLEQRLGASFMGNNMILSNGEATVLNVVRRSLGEPPVTGSSTNSPSLFNQAVGLGADAMGATVGAALSTGTGLAGTSLGDASLSDVAEHNGLSGSPGATGQPVLQPAPGFTPFTPDAVQGVDHTTPVGVLYKLPKTTTTKPHTSSGGSFTSTPAAPMFTLIKGDAADAVYVLNNRGERFQVSETLMHEMQQGGSWYEPEVKPQGEVNAMTLRYTVDSTANLGTINNAVVGNNMMLVKGDGGPLDNNTLVGNGNAVYAVDASGNKFHVTEGAYNDLINQNGGAMPPVATITQAAVDSSPINGALADAGGAVTVTTDPVMDQALASAQVIVNGSPATPATPATPAVPATPDAPATPAVPATPATPAAPAEPADEALAVGQSAESTNTFRLVKGNGGDLPDDQLVGNGRAIYAVNAAGQKFHVTGELYNQMTANGTWKEPETLDQGAVDAMQNGSTVSLTNIDQLRSINIGAGSEFRLVRGGLNNTGTFDGSGNGPLEGNSAAVYAVTSTGERYHVTADVANKLQAAGAYSVEQLDQNEVDHNMGVLKGEVKSVAELNHAVKSAGAATFDGDTSGLPGGIPPIQGYPPQQ